MGCRVIEMRDWDFLANLSVNLAVVPAKLTISEANSERQLLCLQRQVTQAQAVRPCSHDLVKSHALEREHPRSWPYLDELSVAVAAREMKSAMFHGLHSIHTCQRLVTMLPL